jgi:hypothetical protein
MEIDQNDNDSVILQIEEVSEKGEEDQNQLPTLPDKEMLNL